MSSLSEF